MKTLLLRLIAAYVGICACVLAGTLVWLPVGGLLGRDLRPMAATAGALLLALGAFVRGRLEWRIGDFLGGAAAAEATLLLAISHFSGSTGPDLLHSFNLRWWAALSLFVALPWLTGYAVGCWWLRKRRARQAAGCACHSEAR